MEANSSLRKPWALPLPSLTTSLSTPFLSSLPRHRIEAARAHLTLLLLEHLSARLEIAVREEAFVKNVVQWYPRMGLPSIEKVVEGGRFEEQVDKLRKVREWRAKAEERVEE